jgi:hypothetical protein
MTIGRRPRPVEHLGRLGLRRRHGPCRGPRPAPRAEAGRCR